MYIYLQKQDLLSFNWINWITISTFPVLCSLNFLILKNVQKKISRYSIKSRLLWISCCMLVGAFLIFAIPLNTRVGSYHTLKIIATGVHEPQAKGSEVWIHSIKVGEGFELNKATYIFHKLILQLI